MAWAARVRFTHLDRPRVRDARQSAASLAVMPGFLHRDPLTHATVPWSTGPDRRDSARLPSGRCARGRRASGRRASGARFSNGTRPPVFPGLMRPGLRKLGRLTA